MTLIARTRRSRVGSPVSIVAALAVAIAPRPGSAQSTCFADAARVCPGVNGLPVLACLRQRWSDLTGSCQGDLDELRRRAAEFQSDCRLDVLRHCRGLPAGQGKILSCLDQNATLLSSTCVQAVAIAMEKVETIAEACPADLESLCPNVPAGEGRRFLCLKANEQRLSDGCREAVRP